MSELRGVLKNAFQSCGGITSEVPAENTTKICNVCGVVEVFDAAALVMHTCSACGSLWDQDSNAGHVLLARRERLRAEEEAEGVRAANAAKSEGRWERARRRSTERKGRMTTARELESKSS